MPPFHLGLFAGCTCRPRLQSQNCEFCLLEVGHLSSYVVMERVFCSEPLFGQFCGNITVAGLLGISPRASRKLLMIFYCSLIQETPCAESSPHAYNPVRLDHPVRVASQCERVSGALALYVLLICLSITNRGTRAS